MEGYIAEIRLFAGNFAPRNWAFCQGQILAIASNTALFSLLGTTYGGNGTTTFALPDLRGRTAVGTGQGPGLNGVVLGEVSGSETATLTVNHLPAHSHQLMGSNAVANTPSPEGAALAVSASDGLNYQSGNINTVLAAGSVAPAGGSQPFGIRNPFLGMNYIICMFGIYPSRN